VSVNMRTPRIQSLVRWRAGLAVAAVLVPLALYVLFERQARRLDALASEGAPIEAQVTRVSGSITDYAYRVDGVEYRWNVARERAPYAVGQRFVATYLPSDPSLSRPIAERSLASVEAVHNRSFAGKVVVALALVLAFLAFLVHRDVRRAHSGAPSEATDPAAYRRRLALVGAVLLPLLLLITGYHAKDALERGESIVPVALGLALSLAIIGGVFFYAARNGPGEARARAAKLIRWVAPLAIGVALVRLLVFLFAG
jgi:hypothetical protein